MVKRQIDPGKKVQEGLAANNYPDFDKSTRSNMTDLLTHTDFLDSD